MAKTPTFHGKYVYYENINGKEKKVEKTFADQKSFDAFTKKNPLPKISMPTWDFGWIDDVKTIFNHFVDQNYGLPGITPSSKTLISKSPAKAKKPAKPAKKAVAKKVVKKSVKKVTKKK